MKKTIFISDLHLDENRPEITQLFLELLNRLKKSNHTVDALYILGDLFEVWIGDDHDTFLYHHVIKSMASATQNGLPIFFLHGNRDFLIGKKFLRESGCQLLTDETKIKLYNTLVLIMHGDTLCTRDIHYLKARKLLRNPFVQLLFLSLPLTIRKKLAKKFRAKSLAHTTHVPMEIMDVTQEEVIQKMQQYNVKNLIHGHTHQPGIHDMYINQIATSRIVLGAWHETGNMLVWDESGNKTLVNFNHDNLAEFIN